MLVVADASPLRYLIAINQQELLVQIFEEVVATSAVIAELTAPSTPEIVRATVRSHPDWLLVRDPASEFLTRISSALDNGERTALAIALELGADLVLIDDAQARREAAILGLRMTGTIGVLRVAAERGLIDVPTVLSKLQTSGFYIRESVIRSAFAEWL